MTKNLPFINEMKDLVNNLVREIYAGTDYWSTPDNGVVNPVTENDREGWSSINFINTNTRAHKILEREMIKSLTRDIACDKFIDYNKLSGEHKYNYYLLKYVEKHGKDLLSPDSDCLVEIIDAINETRDWGNDAEERAGYVLTKMNHEVDKVSGDGKIEDFKGLDCLVDGKTAQIKRCRSVVVDRESKKFYFVSVPNPNLVMQDYFVLVNYESANDHHPFLLVYVFENEIHEQHKTPHFIHPSHPLYEHVHKGEKDGYYLPIESLKHFYKADLRGDDIIRVRPIG